MHPPSSTRRILAAASAALLTLTLAAQPAQAGPQGPGRHGGPVQLERLDRGLVAVPTAQGVFLSWRLLGDEVTGHGPRGLTGTDFRVYRDGRPIATVTDSTNYLDTTGTPASRYQVAPIVKGREGKRGPSVTPWVESFHDIPLKKPADGVTPAGEAYTYSANDLSVGDVDGDGQYEYVVKW